MDIAGVDAVVVPKAVNDLVETDMYLNFSISSNLTGRIMVPWLDTQEVTTAIPSPMGGAGLYYRYREGYAGFLAVKLFTYDVSQNVDEAPSYD